MARVMDSSSVFMFTEDVALGMLPLGRRAGGSRDSGVEISVDDDDRDRVIGLLSGIGSHRWEGASVEDLLLDAVEGVARRLATDGRAVYEVVRGLGGHSVVRLVNVNPERLVRVGNVFVGYAGKGRGEGGNRRWRVFGGDAMWVVSLPREAGGRRLYKKTLRRLRLRRHLIPEFAMGDLADRGFHRWFDLEEYRKREEMLEARDTAMWGWNRRDYTEANWTTFYRCYRTLGFREMQARVREHVVTEFDRLFEGFELQVRVEVKGVSSGREIAAIRQRLVRGEIGIKEATDMASIFR